jgi:hypothetical protein
MTSRVRYAMTASKRAGWLAYDVALIDRESAVSRMVSGIRSSNAPQSDEAIAS